MKLSTLLTLVHLPLLLLASSQTCQKLTVRREWRTLTSEDKAAWLSGVKCLASLRHERLSFTAQGTQLPGSHSLYDDFSYTHDALEDSAHLNAYFLPWHRWFLHLFDTALRQKCGFNGPTPYWDWSLDSTSPIASPIFDPDPTHGLGSNGDCTNTDCLVLDGALAASFPLAYPVPHTLRRNLSLPLDTTLTPHAPGDFFRFQYSMAMVHNRVHNFVGGDMATKCPAVVPVEACTHSYASNDPLFWLHHAQLDRLWSSWQSADPSNAYAFSGFPLNSHNLSDPRYDLNASTAHLLEFDRLSVPVLVSQVFDHRVLPFCYDYEEGMVEH